MKKMILLISVLCITTTNIIAQNQVRGVETKLVQYEGTSYVRTNTIRYTYSDRDVDRSYNLWFGYSFYNMNSIPVSVDAKLYERRSDSNMSATLVETKSFVLNSKESYIWKHEKRDAFKVFEDYYDSNEKKRVSPITVRSEMDESRHYSKNSYEYYVEYEAYKLE